MAVEQQRQIENERENYQHRRDARSQRPNLQWKPPVRVRPTRIRLPAPHYPVSEIYNSLTHLELFFSIVGDLV